MWLLLLVVLVFAAPAEAVTLVTPDGQVAQPEQRWADEAKVPTAVATITVHREHCPDSVEPTCASIGHIWIAPGWGTRAIFFHELGHVFDYYALTDGDRSAFGAILHDRRPWRVEGGDAPVERLADTYSMCARRRRMSAHYWTELRWDERSFGPLLGGPRSAREYARACSFLRRVGGWYMRPIAVSGSAG